MADLEKIQQHIDLSRKYLEAAEILREKELLEPALFDALHSIELAVKAILYTVVTDDIYTHQVAGMFGKRFRKKVGNELCKRVARTLANYSIPRYPDSEEIDIGDVTAALVLAKELLDDIVPEFIDTTTIDEE